MISGDLIMLLMGMRVITCNYSVHFIAINIIDNDQKPSGCIWQTTIMSRHKKSQHAARKNWTI